MSREMTDAEREFMGNLSPTELGVLHILQTEQRAYDNLLLFFGTSGREGAIHYAWGYLRDSIKTLPWKKFKPFSVAWTEP